MINVCVPVLSRYDLLRDMLASCHGADKVYIINNGRDVLRLNAALAYCPVPCEVYLPKVAMGVAESWNWFISNIPEERVIANDDLVFAEDSLRTLTSTPGDIVGHAMVNLCSCFVIRNSCVGKVGLFDETISPGYAYFEDLDYANRMALAGVKSMIVDCGIVHLGSGTVSRLEGKAKVEHDRRFIVAQENFLKKWGKLPAGVQRQGVYV